MLLEFFEAGEVTQWQGINQFMYKAGVSRVQTKYYGNRNLFFVSPWGVWWGDHVNAVNTSLVQHYETFKCMGLTNESSTIAVVGHTIFTFEDSSNADQFLQRTETKGKRIQMKIQAKGKRRIKIKSI